MRQVKSFSNRLSGERSVARLVVRRRVLFTGQGQENATDCPRFVLDAGMLQRRAKAVTIFPKSWLRPPSFFYGRLGIKRSSIHCIGSYPCPILQPREASFCSAGANNSYYATHSTILKSTAWCHTRIAYALPSHRVLYVSTYYPLPTTSSPPAIFTTRAPLTLAC
ncbi:hypothetical protein JAAARDRAFT_425147 [Jaapia argillacea MUCL 33604]|uniref:Uncharacterized protein n=1 Tax=Jaapia argillacea MUCL 33604 TaxID=933084 RepID=A0A067PFE3_9AGAM|nr:hypothetical protein JAAARDRAFT_425147 [Jaapia argillacea MUCL 33604]